MSSEKLRKEVRMDTIEGSLRSQVLERPGRMIGELLVSRVRGEQCEGTKSLRQSLVDDCKPGS